ncbi:hypothetical protein QQY66_49195 [Streptomyces sp. DG2A-72]|uniref:ParB/RepB/Spo0J family partition protein n=1 Tax=Streptomyces sp. DG2A-72 TaxID=3051386 RepID=UPI00265C4C0D|nr:hypothetical protein [Streptomyces sp. DG2A-72]MDO0939291.1 hypothetical protein [Streptomyces sp. DG2A-72]
MTDGRAPTVDLAERMDQEEAAPEGRWMPLAECALNPRNPRDNGLPDDLSDLEGIKERQLQSCLAITVAAYLRLWPADRQRFESEVKVVIINGNRRRRSAEKYGRGDLFVVTDDTIATSRADVMRAAYDENTKRRDFDPIEEAVAVVGIVAEYETAKEAAEAEGWSPSWISHRKNLLKLHPELQEEVRARARGEEGLSINVARRLGAVKGISDMDLGEQRQALAELLRADGEASKERKAARRRAREERAAPAPVPAPEPSPTPVPRPAEPTEHPEAPASAGGSSSAGPEFSAENSNGVVVPEQRAAAVEAAPAPAEAEEETAGEEAADVEQREAEVSPPAGVPITTHVPAPVAAVFKQVADHLSHGHRVPVTVADVVGLVLEYAARNGVPPLPVLSGRVEGRHGEQLGNGGARFTWRPAGAGSVRTAERQLKGHPSSGLVNPLCAAPIRANSQPCDRPVIWKIQDPERGTFYYCDADLPAEDVPPGVWRG